MNISRITSVTLPAVVLALAFLLPGCAGKKAESPAPRRSAPIENYSNVPLAPSIHGPSVAYADPMWKAYASRGQAFANCGGVSAAPPQAVQPRAASAGASSGARARPRTGGQAKTGRPAAKATAKAAPKVPQDAALAGVVCPDGCVPAPICPDGCVPAPGQQGASGQRGPAPAVPGAAKTTAPQTPPSQTSASYPGSPQAPPPAYAATATASPATATASPATAQNAAELPGTPPPALTGAPLQGPENAPPAPAVTPATTTAPIAPLFTPPDGVRQDASAPLEMPATAPPVPTGAALGSMSAGAPR